VRWTWSPLVCIRIHFPRARNPGRSVSPVPKVLPGTSMVRKFAYTLLSPCRTRLICNQNKNQFLTRSKNLCSFVHRVCYILIYYIDTEAYAGFFNGVGGLKISYSFIFILSSVIILDVYLRFFKMFVTFQLFW